MYGALAAGFVTFVLSILFVGLALDARGRQPLVVGQLVIALFSAGAVLVAGLLFPLADVLGPVALGLLFPLLLMLFLPAGEQDATA